MNGCGGNWNLREIESNLSFHWPFGTLEIKNQNLFFHWLWLFSAEKISISRKSAYNILRFGYEIPYLVELRQIFLHLLKSEWNGQILPLVSLWLAGIVKNKKFWKPRFPSLSKTWGSSIFLTSQKPWNYVSFWPKLYPGFRSFKSLGGTSFQELLAVKESLKLRKTKQ